MVRADDDRRVPDPWLQRNCVLCTCERKREAMLKPIKPAKAPLERLGEVEYALGELAAQIAFGSSKQGRVVGDWRKLSRLELIGKAIRHLLSAAAGQKLDAEGRSHLVAALADCAMAVEQERA